VTERMVTMIVLLAIDSLGEVEALQPIVQPEHDGWKGHEAGESVTQPQEALAYILECFPQSVQSYAQLSPTEQHTLCFVGCFAKINTGWLVQSEAPPGAVFGSLKEHIAATHASRHEVSLFLVASLARFANSRPLRGLEVFYLRFPQHVLRKYIRSFRVSRLLAVRSATQVYERHLELCYGIDVEGMPKFDERPSVTKRYCKIFPAIALMRLSLHVQSPSERAQLLEAYACLPPQARSVLEEEMSATGIPGEAFEDTQASGRSAPLPAIILHRSPQFVRHMTKSGAGLAALGILAEIYRVAREMWPRSSASHENLADYNVTVQMGELVECASAADIVAVHFSSRKMGWYLIQQDDEREAKVEQLSDDDRDEMMADDPTMKCLSLALWNLPQGSFSSYTLLELFHAYKDDLLDSEENHTARRVSQFHREPSSSSRASIARASVARPRYSVSPAKLARSSLDSPSVSPSVDSASSTPLIKPFRTRQNAPRMLPPMPLQLQAKFADNA